MPTKRTKEPIITTPGQTLLDVMGISSLGCLPWLLDSSDLLLVLDIPRIPRV